MPLAVTAPAKHSLVAVVITAAARRGGPLAAGLSSLKAVAGIVIVDH